MKMNQLKYDKELIKKIFNSLGRDEDKNLGRENILIVDGTNNFIRNFIANPLLNDNGEHVGGYIGFLLSLSKILKNVDIDRCIIIFDGKNNNKLKSNLLESYKNGRKIRYNRKLYNISLLNTESEYNEDLFFFEREKQYKILLEYLNNLPLETYIFDNIEADNVIGYISYLFYINSNNNILILSSDKDMYQLVNDRISIINPLDKTVSILNKNNIIEKLFGLLPENYIFYKIIKGDISDNIESIKKDNNSNVRLGLKTFIKIFPELMEKKYSFNDFINLCKKKIEFEENKNKKELYNIILNNQDILFRNYKLMCIIGSDVDKEVFPFNIKMQLINIINKKENKQLIKHKIYYLFNRDRVGNIIKNYNLFLLPFYNICKKYYIL